MASSGMMMMNLADLIGRVELVARQHAAKLDPLRHRESLECCCHTRASVGGGQRDVGPLLQTLCGCGAWQAW